MSNASRADVARLFGRVAFGATSADLAAWTGKPYEQAVDALLDVPSGIGRTPQADDAERIALTYGSASGLDTLERAQEWWLERMRTTPYPLEERLTLLWHGHFATALSTPQPGIALLLAQNQLLRQYALGSVRDLLAGVAVDPAMLFWLNGTDSAPPLPNENFAREFFELFSLGRMPQVYTERDVREAARAFTGWVADATTQSASFSAARHDPGNKRILGRSIGDQGAVEYLSVVDAALAQPVAYRFLAWKLVAHLAYLPAPEDPLVHDVAGTLAAGGGRLQPALRTLLLSPRFRRPGPSRQLVRSPVEGAVAACKALGISAASPAVTGALTQMGQRLFAPPNVGGWPVGADWLSPPSVIARYDLGLALAAAVRGTFGATALPASGDLAAWADRLCLPAVSASTRTVLRRFLDRSARSTESSRQDGVLALLLSSPEWTVM